MTALGAGNENVCATNANVGKPALGAATGGIRNRAQSAAISCLGLSASRRLTARFEGSPASRIL